MTGEICSASSNHSIGSKADSETVVNPFGEGPSTVIHVASRAEAILMRNPKRPVLKASEISARCTLAAALECKSGASNAISPENLLWKKVFGTNLQRLQLRKGFRASAKIGWRDGQRAEKLLCRPINMSGSSLIYAAPLPNSRQWHACCCVVKFC